MRYGLTYISIRNLMNEYFITQSPSCETDAIIEYIQLVLN